MSPAPEFREISTMWEFSENDTEFLCYIQNWSKTPQKASECYQNVEKAHKYITAFLHICLKQEAQSRKRPRSSSLPHLQAPAQSHCPSSSAGTSTGEESPDSSPRREILREEYPPSSPPSFSLNTSSPDRKDALPSSLTLNQTPFTRRERRAGRK